MPPQEYSWGYLVARNATSARIGRTLASDTVRIAILNREVRNLDFLRPANIAILPV